MAKTAKVPKKSDPKATPKRPAEDQPKETSEDLRPQLPTTTQSFEEVGPKPKIPRSQTVKPAKTYPAYVCARNSGEIVLAEFAQPIYVLNNDTEGFLCVQHRMEAGIKRSKESVDVAVCVGCGNIFSIDKVAGLEVKDSAENRYICESCHKEATRADLEKPEG